MSVNPVISIEQARQITRGRTPLVPVEYETAIAALSACVTLDETKYWSDKADALAAWAKIYRSNDAMLKAKRLKMHAFRRMGEIAAELRPVQTKKNDYGNTGAGRLPGPVSLLMEQGLSRTSAGAARKLALVSDRKFEKLLEKPKAPVTIAHEMIRRDPTWHEFSRYAMCLRSFCRTNTPASVASVVKSLGDKEASTAKALATELVEWFDAFEQRLPKVKS